MKNSIAIAAVTLGAVSFGVRPLAAQDSQFLRGDVNGDRSMDISDSILVLLRLFASGPEFPCEKAADVDDSGIVNLSDVIFGLSFLFRMGSAPPAPFSRCGADTTADGLSCAQSPCADEVAIVEIAEACSPSPGTQLDWAVTNLLAEPMALHWVIAGSAQGGTLQVPALETVVLSTSRVSGANELVLYRDDVEVGRLAQARVIISEIMASNADSIADEDGDSSDWIEIHVVDGPCSLAVDLGGWYLTDDPTEPRQWRFPSVTLDSGGYLLVFASGKDRAVAGSELHASFKLDTGGEYLALVAPDGVTIVDELSPAYPEQLTDVSYGLAQSTTTLVKAGTRVQYRVPTSGDAALGEAWADPDYSPSGWREGANGLGFSGFTTQGFEVTCVKANVAVDSLTTAEAVLRDPSQQAQVFAETASVIDYFNSGESGNYLNDNPFPGLGSSDVEDFVVEVVATVLIPEAGAWSFGVNSDDGFGLVLTNGSQTFNMSYPAPRGPADTIQVFNATKAGPYELRLVFYERGGGSELELFAAKGNHPGFTYDYFRLVGDTAAGGLGLLGFAADIGTDVGPEMRNVNASIWARMPFEVEDPGSLGGLWLRMKYEDGFVAYLNGQKVASRNAPASPQWSSRATADRPIEDVSVVEEINLTSHLGLLRDGSNVLAIHGLNNSPADSDFLILPELISASSASRLQYMSHPTPGSFNVAGSVDFVRSVEFSVERGFFAAPFQLVLSTPTPGAQIRYTLDGSTPTATKGAVYGGPLTVDRSTVLRAAGFKPGHLDSAVRTKTYLFLGDVIRQSPAGQAPGPGWPTGRVNGQILDYGMDPDIVNNPLWSGWIENALRDIPSVSLVTDLENLFSPSTGIYVNAARDGLAWERRTSVELLHPDGTPGFGVDAGLRIRGAFSRSGENPKHAFRLFFRNAYGTGKLDYPLFGGEGVDQFDKVDLRTSQNNSWAYEGSPQNTLLRDVFSRDVQRDMRQPYTRSRYYHIYLNGQYWGLYQTEERADASFAESYLVGDDGDYDAIKNDSSGSRALQATDGTIAAYRRLYDAAVAGLSTNAAYRRVQGLKADGSPDPAGEKLLDPENLMDYMACTYYTGDPDAPVSCWAHISNNIFALYNRAKPSGFVWFRHDAEHSLGANGGLNEGRLLTDPTDRTIGQDWNHFNPAWLHLRLCDNAEYALRFADRVNAYFRAGGLLASAANSERWLARADEIDLAIIAESARWGDAKTHPPRSKNDWQAQVDYMVGTYFPQRTQIVIAQMRSVGMFPDLAMVSYSQHGGAVEPGFELRMSQANGTPGTIYYTLDGSDPRVWGGGISGSALIFDDETTGVTFIGRGASWRYKDDGSDQGTAWRDPGFADGAWKEGPGQLGYGDGDEATVVSYGPSSSNKYPTTYFRRAFDVTNASDVTQVTLGIVRDDGAVVYLNGVEATPRINLPSGEINYLTLAQGPGVPVGGTDESTFYTYDVDPKLLVEGRNVIAVEIHQESRTSTDISFDLELIGLVAGDASPPIVIGETTTVKARAYGAGRWGALTEARFTVGLEGLVINEVMADNDATLEDPDEPGEFPDWIEIFNGTQGTIDLSGMYLSDDLQDLAKWQIGAGVSIGPGRYLVFFADDDGTQGVYHTNFKLSSSGESVALVDRDGTTIVDEVVFGAQFQDFAYGRYPDGGDAWAFLERATPGAPNAPHVR